MRTKRSPLTRYTGALGALALLSLALVILQPPARAEAASTCAGFIPSTITTAAQLTTAVTQAQSGSCPGSDVIDLAGNTITFTTASSDSALPTVTTGLTIMNGAITRVSSVAFRFILVGPTGNLTLTDVTFSNGLGPASGDVGGGAVLNRGFLQVSGGAFLQNSAGVGGDGGAILNEGVLTVSDSELGSGGARAGGGVYNSGSATVLRSTIFDNSATGGAGGGVASVGALELRDSLVHGNSSTSGGAGVDLAAAPATTPAWVLANSTIADNTGAFGVHHDGGALTLVNNIISGTAGGSDCAPAASPTVAAAQANLIQTDACFSAGYQLNADPLFEAPSGPTPSYRPSGASPVLDAGTDDAGSTTDLDGNARVRGYGIDMGAYERAGQDVTIQFAAATSSTAEAQPLADLLLISTSDGEPTRASATVQVAVVGGSASAADYTVSGTVTVAAGSANGGLVSLATGFSVVDDAAVESDETVELQLSASTRAALGAQTTTTHTIVNDDAAGFSVSAPSTALSEPGGSATFSVVPTSQPTGLIRLDLTASDPSECVVSPTSLSFDASSWSVPQIVTITAVDDTVTDGSQPCTIAFGRNAASTAADYPSGVLPASFAVAVSDDDASILAAVGLAITGAPPLLGAGFVALALAGPGIALALAARTRARRTS